MYRPTVHQGLSPAYLSEQVNNVVAQPLRSPLRSASTTNYAIGLRVLRLLTKFDVR